jgi:hypothetical protein
LAYTTEYIGRGQRVQQPEPILITRMEVNMPAVRLQRIREATKFLTEARRAATFKTAGFQHAGFKGIDPMSKEYSDEIREATRIYRESWILPYIDAALNVIEMEIAHATGKAEKFAEESAAMRETWGQLTYGRSA